MRVDIHLPQNRAIPGWLRVVDERAVNVFSCAALGKADNQRAAQARNPSRNPLFPFGDTPLGTWQGRLSARPMADTRVYGIHRVLMLTPTSGDALVAHGNGRRGIWLHGGALRVGRLRPTHGCIRVADDHMAAIIEIVSPLVQQVNQWIPVETLAA